MTALSLRESAESEPIDLAPASVQALTLLGRRLASQRSWWGQEEDEAQSRETTAIKCIPSANGQWRVRVDNAVGVLSVGDLQIAVQPKIPLAHFLHLMAAAEAIPRVDEERASIAPDESLWELVAEWFVSSAETLLRRGLIRDYQAERDDLVLVRGRVHGVSTATNFYRGRLAFDCEYEDFSIDTALNRIVLAAARVVAGSPLLHTDLRRRALAVTVHMDEGVGGFSTMDLFAHTDRRTVHYHGPIALARHILRREGRTLATGEALGWSFLIPTPALVEEGIRRILIRGLAPEWEVAKKGRQLEGSSLTLTPDLVFGTNRAVGDVKYKLTGPTWNRGDLYEVISFGVAFRTSYVSLVTFSDSSDVAPFKELRVGDMRVSHLVWAADPRREPTLSADLLVAQARVWLAEATRHDPAAFAAAI
jgi:5-methylcytosine-specific restriction endonuclease McrBC regulatory subunit McrC